MRRTCIVIIIVVTVLAGAFFWLVRGRTLVLNLDARELAAVVDLSFFHPLKPGMRRSEIRALVGEPERVHVTDLEYDEDGKIEYQEIRWVFPRAGGVLAYYVEEYDTSGGSVEYVPQKMTVEELFRIPVSVGLGKRFIEVRNQGRCLIQVRLQGRDRIEKVNWYWTE